ncbi:uncharacterized protein LOC18781955 isoform X1 [Prunus persica]|nr:uncharacterized protein LOC18781955 isoform X1 [Prunus persica]XP_020416008.1 uncharacterized protein LOC18781955 isoform X1 [Prunus persica]
MLITLCLILRRRSIQMENKDSESRRKRMKPDEEEEGAISDSEKAQNEELETFVAGSEEVELAVAHILEKIERFTQLVSELLGSGKAMFQKIGDEFEERMIMVHKEQIEKWQEEIRELRILDASNEEANALLHNARGLLHHAHVDS